MRCPSCRKAHIYNCLCICLVSVSVVCVCVCVLCLMLLFPFRCVTDTSTHVSTRYVATNNGACAKSHSVEVVLETCGCGCTHYLFCFPIARFCDTSSCSTCCDSTNKGTSCAC